MPYILVRNSMNVERLPDNGSLYRVAKDAYGGTETYIDFNYVPSRTGTLHGLANAIMKALEPVTVVEFVRPDPVFPRQDLPASLFSTRHPPFVVLEELQELGFTVNAVNTVGVTTVWTLQGTPNHQRIAYLRGAFNQPPPYY